MFPHATNVEREELSEEEALARFEVSPPLRIEEIDPEDLVVCRCCGCTVCLTGVKNLEEREVPDVLKKTFGKTRVVKGVFCQNPGCGQLLMDQEGLIDHLATKKRNQVDQEEEPETTPEGAAAE